MATLTVVDLPLKKIASGKVRELYEIPEAQDLLFVTSDRISCFDVVNTVTSIIVSNTNSPLLDTKDRKKQISGLLCPLIYK